MWRAELDHAVREAVQRTRLAVGEIVERHRVENGVIVERRVVNPDAIGRAIETYGVAQQLIGKARILDGTANGVQRADRRFLQDAHREMQELWGKIEAARVLAGL